MATPNYGYEKRQRELAKKQKKLDKERAKEQRKNEPVVHSGVAYVAPDDTTPAAGHTPVPRAPD